jgi:hypothetical protein
MTKSTIAVALLALASLGAHALCLVTNNATPNWAWYTMYDLGRTRQLDYGWVGPFSRRVWCAGNYNGLGYYQVRAEVKAGQGPNPPSDQSNVFDTSMQIHGLETTFLKTPIRIKFNGLPKERWFYDGRTFYLETNDGDPPAAESLDLHALALLNNSPFAVRYRIVWYTEETAFDLCVNPGARSSVMVPVRSTSPTARILLKGASCMHRAGTPGSVNAPPIYMASVPVTGPVPKLTFSAGLHATQAGNAGAVMLVNSSPYVVEFAFGATTRCLAPQGRESVAAPAGSLAVTAGVKSDCGPGSPRVGDSRVNASLSSSVGAQVEFKVTAVPTDL